MASRSKSPTCSIAIVGGGVQGISLLHILNKCGHQVKLFEKSHQVGGVWSNHGRVPYMRLQLNSKIYRFPNHPHPENIDMPYANYIQHYLQTMVNEKGLSKYIVYNVEIDRAQQISAEEYVLFDKQNRKINGVFQYVIYTGTASVPRIPPLFKNVNNVLHSSVLSQINIDKLKNKRCIVYGGSKSAAEMALVASRSGASSVIWIARRFCNFVKFKPGTTVDMVDVFKSALNMNMKTVYQYKILPDDESHFGSGNLLTIQQYDELMKVDRIRDEIELLQNDNTLLLKHSNKKIPFDYILLGTGYEKSVIKTDKCNPLRVVHTDQVERPWAFLTFGIADAHIRSTVVKGYIANESDVTLEEFSQNYKIGISGIMWQLQYVCTSGEISPMDEYNPAIAVLIVFIIVTILLIFVAQTLKLTYGGSKKMYTRLIRNRMHHDVSI